MACARRTLGAVGATQWRHPAILGLASLGGVWLVSFALVAVNTALAIALVSARLRARRYSVVALVAGLLGPLAYRLRGEPRRSGPLRWRSCSQASYTAPPAASRPGSASRPGCRRVDLVVWGESSVGFDLDRRADLLARLTALARAHGDAAGQRGRARRARAHLQERAADRTGRVEGGT